MHSFSEENYLKTIYHLSAQTEIAVSTNALADKMQTRPSSVTDMIKKLAEKALISYTPYQGVSLTDSGMKAALSVIRRHRLWEVFLVDTLNFTWDEVHVLAEELEHIPSVELTNRLDAFLKFPKSDPHGDPIPDRNGKFTESQLFPLTRLAAGDRGIITGVGEHSSPFLKHLKKIGLTLGQEITVVNVAEYDGSMDLLMGKEPLSISRDIAKNILMNR